MDEKTLKSRHLVGTFLFASARALSNNRLRIGDWPPKPVARAPPAKLSPNSHDSRDKAEIAEPIALQLMKMMCPVWYDQFSLRVGDSLRESIEQGLKQCSKCILVLTPNVIANKGGTKREYDSIFTRELIEKQKVILLSGMRRRLNRFTSSPRSWRTA